MQKTLLAALCVAGVSLSQPAMALNILLTNDDGCRAPGINAMYQALTDAGHQVTLVGPLNDSSGIGAASVVNPGQTLSISELQANRYCVGPPADYTAPTGKTSAIGTPVDAVNAGLDLLLKDNPPDLVVSGSNFGENTGPLVQMSGTVNAALRAMIKGIPAVAVSTAIDMQLIMQDKKAGYQKTLDAQDATARFAVRVIDSAIAAGKQACAATPNTCAVNLLGLPKGYGLNINYPALAQAHVKGVRYAPIGDWSPINFTTQRSADGSITVNLSAPPAPSAEQQAGDAYQLMQGHAVISVISSNLTAPAALQQQAQAMYGTLKP